MPRRGPFGPSLASRHDRRRPLVGRPDDVGGGGVGARLVEQLRPLPLGVRTDRGGLLPCLGERLLGCPRVGVGAAPGALERRLGLQPGALDNTRLLGLPAGDGPFALVKLGALVRERPPDVRAREPLADELEVAVDLVGVIAATHPAEGPLDNEHRQRLTSGGHGSSFAAGTHEVLPRAR